MTTTALPADPRSGYFGPGSATWRVMADPAAGVGGLAALFVQALHPRAMAPGLPTTDLAAGLAVRALRAGVLTLPESWRHGPTAREALERERLGDAA
jgi:uncharacterized protein (DUF2236 family)